MTCPICHGKGYTSAPYIYPHLSTMTACTCPAGKAFTAQFVPKKDKAK